MKIINLKTLASLILLLASITDTVSAMEQEEYKTGELSLKISRIRNNTDDTLIIIPEIFQAGVNITEKGNDEADDEYKTRIDRIIKKYKLTKIVPHSSERLNVTLPTKALDPYVLERDQHDFEKQEQELFSERLMVYNTTTRELYTLHIQVSLDYMMEDRKSKLRWKFTIKNQDNTVLASEASSISSTDRGFRIAEAILIASYVINDPIKDSIIDVDFIVKDKEEEKF